MKNREMHGLVKSPEYISWRGMLDRCRNPRHAQYKDYGQRGITVCLRWQQSFLAFLQDMGPRPPKHYIERLENSKGYEPGNCCWATKKQQSRNKRNNRLIAAFGQTKTLAAWAEETGLAATAIRARLVRGMPAEQALTLPSGQPKCTARNLTACGRTQSITEWAAELGTTRSAIQSRLRSGMPVEAALSLPFTQNLRLIAFRGTTQSMTAWAKQLGWPMHVIQNRLRAGWPVERVLTTPWKRMK